MRSHPRQVDLLDRIVDLERRLRNIERTRQPEVNLQYRGYPSSEYDTPPQTFTSSSYVSVFRIEGRRQHRRIYVKLRVTTPSGTTANIRLQDNTNSITVAETSVGANLDVDVFLMAEMPEEILFGSDFVLEIEAQRTAGTGTVRIGLATTYGYTNTGEDEA